MNLFLLPFLLVWSSQASAGSLRTSVEAYVKQNQQPLLLELVELLSIPNVSADRENIRRNALFLRRLLERRGFQTNLLETPGNPLVYAERKVTGAERTLLFYAHYDGQPVDRSQWRQDDPFTPILRTGKAEEGAPIIPDFEKRGAFEDEWRLYARSSSDDKSPILALCAALDFLQASGSQPSSNVRVLLDGEEEIGSPHLVPAIARHRDKLDADLMLILDGPLHPSGRPTVVFGARGILTLELTVFGPRTPLHSGHYGNWVPNPAHQLALLLASMKNDGGEVLIDGFYDGIQAMTPEEQRALDEVPDDPGALMRLYGFSQPEHPGRSLQASLQLPSLNIRGLSAAFVGEQARTVIPDRAVAALDVRLVKETPAAAMRAKLLAHIAGQGFWVVETDPDETTRALRPRIVKVEWRSSTNAYRTSPLDPAARQVADALARTFGGPPVRIRTMGGTVPIAPFIEAMGFPALSVPTVNFDNNQHSENENLRLGSFFQGVTTLAALLTM